MSEEEKKAIELIKQYRKEIKDGDIKPIFILDTAINLITRLQKENEEYKYLYKKALDNTVKSDKENIQLKKQIDLISEKLAKAYHYIPNKCSLKEKENIDCSKYNDCTSCVKNYFEKTLKENK